MAIQLHQPTEYPAEQDISYPESDGQPMADNTKQFRWIVVIKEGLEWLFQTNPNVFVAGDLLWYPVEGDNSICTSPDILVAFGRPKGDRGSYQQWQEGNIPPQVVFEVRSPSNTQTELDKKQMFYDRYGVEEYYLYNPDKNDLSGWLRSGDRLAIIDPISDWASPRLGVRFKLAAGELQIDRPDGQRFLTYVELAQRAEQAEVLLEQERQQNRRLAERLRALGVDPDGLLG